MKITLAMFGTTSEVIPGWNAGEISEGTSQGIPGQIHWGIPERGNYFPWKITVGAFMTIDGNLMKMFKNITGTLGLRFLRKIL